MMYATTPQTPTGERANERETRVGTECGVRLGQLLCTNMNRLIVIPGGSRIKGLHSATRVCVCTCSAVCERV